MRYEVWEKLAHKYNRLWVQKYSLRPTRRDVKTILMPLIKKNPDLKILDIGCGTGQLAKEVSARFPKVNYMGIDVASNMVALAKAANKGENVRFKVCPIEKFNADEKFDVIICTHSFPYFPDKEKMLGKIVDMCKDGGNVIIVNSSTNSLKDLIINFFLKATTSKAEYLSIPKMKKLFKATGLTLKKKHIIREKFYMPTLALFYLEK